jgi:hypothetical protein
MSKDNALSMIQAQLFNAGVGRYANAVMAWSGIFGPSYPTAMPANGNDIIDSLQQTADIAAFNYIDGGIHRMEQLLMKKAAKDGIPVDKFVFQTRFSAEMHETVPADLIMEKGKFSRMSDAYLEAFGKIQDIVRIASFEFRMNASTRNKVMEAIPTVKPGTAAWALEFWSKYNAMLERADVTYKQKTSKGNISRFAKAFAERERTETISKVVEEMYSEITSYESGHPDKWAVALYRWIIDPALTRTKYGKSDRIIFQNGHDGQDTIMDLLIQGINNL